MGYEGLAALLLVAASPLLLLSLLIGLALRALGPTTLDFFGRELYGLARHAMLPPHPGRTELEIPCDPVPLTIGLLSKRETRPNLTRSFVHGRDVTKRSVATPPPIARIRVGQILHLRDERGHHAVELHAGALRFLGASRAESEDLVVGANRRHLVPVGVAVVSGFIVKARAVGRVAVRRAFGPKLTALAHLARECDLRSRANSLDERHDLLDALGALQGPRLLTARKFGLRSRGAHEKRDDLRTEMNEPGLPRAVLHSARELFRALVAQARLGVDGDGRVEHECSGRDLDVPDPRDRNHERRIHALSEVRGHQHLTPGAGQGAQRPGPTNRTRSIPDKTLPVPLRLAPVVVPGHALDVGLHFKPPRRKI